MRISIIGLGYVGAVTSVCLTKLGHTVIGVDVDPQKVKLLADGVSPIVEADISEITEEAAQSGRLSTQTQIDSKVAASDIIFVCVGTPSNSNGSQDLTALERVCEQIGEALRETDTVPTIVIRSTIAPGTTEALVAPTIQAASNKQENVGFLLCFQPEFLREGSSVKDFFNPPFTVAGGSKAACDVLEDLFQGFPGGFYETDLRTAELLKVACNCFHAMKVTFANEIGRLGKANGIDSRVLMELLCQDTSLNISPAYLRPGFAFGGSCLPKDLRSLMHVAKSNDVDVPMLDAILPSNVEHIEQVTNEIISRGIRNVAFIGLSFKQGTDDLRESPLVALAERLIGKGFDLRVFDEAVQIALLRGSNLRFIETTIPHIGKLLCSLEECIDDAEVIVVGHKSPEIEDALAGKKDSTKLLVDLVGIDRSGWADYVGAAW